MPTSPSYIPIPECCGQKPCHCSFKDYNDQPCWGEVKQDIVGYEEGSALPTHVCQGHREYVDGGTYNYITEETK